jgi:hypothetical protein
LLFGAAASSSALSGINFFGGVDDHLLGAAAQGFMQLGGAANTFVDLSTGGAAAAGGGIPGLTDAMQHQPLPLPQLQVLQPHGSNPHQQQHDLQQDTQQQQQQQHQLQQASLTAPLQVDVGGKCFRTTMATLLSVHGSLFWQLVQGANPPGMQRLPSGELFIDRSSDVFGFVLEYLRACAHSEPSIDLPSDGRCVVLRLA